jgi:hypothetical protein
MISLKVKPVQSCIHIKITGQKKRIFISKNRVTSITKEGMYIINNRDNAIGDYALNYEKIS